MERAVAKQDRPLRMVSPRLTYCTDNAAMIGAAAHWAIQRGDLAGFDLDVIAREPLTRKG
jgi:tRNA A37 threonylcarbamoyltransferase TsaD